MTKKEVRRWSLVRAINLLAQGKPLDGIEGEASLAVAKRMGKNPTGFYVPHDVKGVSLAEANELDSGTLTDVYDRIAELRKTFNRALNVTTFSAGGALMGTDVLTGSMIELLRNRIKVVQLGARMLTGLVGNIAIPRHTGGATAQWLAEGALSTASQQTFGQLLLTPHRLAVETQWTKQLMMQTSLDVEAFVREDLMATIAVEKDRAAINGSGVLGEPLGILNVTGINSVTFGAAPTWAKVVEFETLIAEDNADFGSLAYLTTPAARGKMKTIEVASTTGIFIWGPCLCAPAPGNGAGTLNGYRAEISNQVPGNRMIFGNWNDVILAEWDGMDIVVDPYTLASANSIRIVINVHGDNGLRHAQSMAASTDSAAQ